MIGIVAEETAVDFVGVVFDAVGEFDPFYVWVRVRVAGERFGACGAVGVNLQTLLDVTGIRQPGDLRVLFLHLEHLFGPESAVFLAVIETVEDILDFFLGELSRRFTVLQVFDSTIQNLHTPRLQALLLAR